MDDATTRNNNNNVLHELYNTADWQPQLTTTRIRKTQIKIIAINSTINSRHDNASC